MPTGENEQHGRNDAPGRVLAGRYRVVSALGRGGMGVVWRAVDEVLGREVAVKELRTYTDAAGPELADLTVRMQREARAAARVRHPGVVAVHDVAEEDGRPVIVMELVDGPSLDGVLSERGTIGPREAAAVGARVMEALGAAHRVGVLHRDVKPGNVLLDRDGRVVLTDFGIATMEDPGDGSTTRLTRSGELLGSLDYLAPERAQGQDPGPASDIWALGATLYAAVEGTSPFRRTSTWSTLTAIVVEELPEPRLAGPLYPVLQRLMDKDPARRPDAETAARLLAAVADGAAAADGEVAGAVPDTAPRPAPETVPRAEAVARAETVLDARPHRPQGFGSPAAGPVGGTGGAAVPPTAGRGRGGGRSKTLLAAGVVAVLLAGGGVAYALANGDGSAAEQRLADEDGARSASPGAGRSLDPGSGASASGTTPSAGPGDGDSEKSTPATPSATLPPSGTGNGTGVAGTGGSGSSPGPSASGTADGSAGAGGSGGDSGPGTSPTPASVCDSIGGGKYNCVVYRTAKSYTASGAEAGVLNAGTNYFFCQQDLGRRETYGEWTNTWWARTDDDSGNSGVLVSVVYIRGGDNDGPVPGLPVC